MVDDIGASGVSGAGLYRYDKSGGLIRIDGGLVRKEVTDASAGGFGAVLDALAEQARHMIPSHQSAVSYIPEGNFEVAAHATSFSEKYARYRSYDVMPTGDGIWSVIFEQGIAMRLTEEELYTHPRFRNFSELKDESGVEHPPMPGWLAVPVKGSSGRSIGLLQLSDRVEGDYTAEDQELLTRLAAVVTPTFEVQFMHEQLAAAKAELERSNKDLEQFAYVASHDLKAPLRAIDNLSSWLEEDLGDRLDPDNREKLRLLRGRVQRMDRLLDDLLEYSRAGRVKHTPETIDLRRLIEESLRLVAPPSFKVDIACEVRRVHTEATPLELILRNLIDNAIKHHDRPDGRVDIACRRESDGLLRFEVTDDGPGVPEELRSKAFQLFQTLKPRDQGGGSGMGLALIRRLVERHGGEVRLETPAGGRGTRAVFTWSIASRRQEP